MSRVEPKDDPAPKRDAERGRTSPAERRADPHPSKAEGEEHDIDEALDRQDETRR
jgi:hypothetical protein